MNYLIEFRVWMNCDGLTIQLSLIRGICLNSFSYLNMLNCNSLCRSKLLDRGKEMSKYRSMLLDRDFDLCLFCNFS